MRLQPDLPEAHLALGFSYYYGDRDYERALTEFEIAKRGLPNEADAYMAIGAIRRRQGRWAESTANLEKAAALDPKNLSVLVNLAYNYMATRNFEAADKTFDRGIQAAPKSFASRALKGGVAIYRKWMVSLAEKQLVLVQPGVDPDGLVTLGLAAVLTFQRKFKEALQLVQQFRGETLLAAPSQTCPKASLEGTLYLYQGDKVEAHSAFERARSIAERLVRESPGDAARHGSLARFSPDSVKKMRRSRRASARLSCCRNRKTLLMGRRSPPGRANLRLDWRTRSSI